MEQKRKIIREYLQNNFPNMQISEKEDFDLCAYSFKLSDDKDLLLLKVGDNFIDDTDEKTLKTLFEQWKIAGLLKQHRTGHILVTNNGPKKSK